ncbi:uncharacterized protein CC84DRAFT_376907 [Paraphaeosphaeria sporulosa]|uniref:Uncharacterized protein n=1 Tax=Paraphaeosphaeria sporulosa TaxID=1460663 RepID=A0A177BZ37_9PLEO|nr:uncharacterized protein CC84DRAFT_376907 [Paraphaeosphaeria sporulosa]OAF99696.1 hypothetical protein CC84DRAFT_376907 [Paraphaeosphaeria sporulosa]
MADSHCNVLPRETPALALSLPLSLCWAGRLLERSTRESGPIHFLVDASQRLTRKKNWTSGALSATVPVGEALQQTLNHLSKFRIRTNFVSVLLPVFAITNALPTILASLAVSHECKLNYQMSTPHPPL